MKRGLLVGLMLVCATVPGVAQRRGAEPPNPFVNSTQGAQQGGELYGKTCTGCHGADGAAGEIGPAIVAANLSERRNSDGPTLAIIRDGVPGTLMPAFKDKLADDDILKIAAYLHALRAAAIDNPTSGNVAQGEAVFWGKGQCGTCHMVGGKGGLTAPDLGNIAAFRKSVTIVDALTRPGHHVFGDGGAHLDSLPPMDTYLPVHVTTLDGKTVDGILLNQDSYSLQLIGNDQQLHLYDRAKLRKVVIDPVSLMPTDYDKRLTADEFKDLMAFLTRQAFPVARTAAAAAGDPQ
jgi:putative heme-binding domain-containing protein